MEAVLSMWENKFAKESLTFDDVLLIPAHQMCYLMMRILVLNYQNELN